MEAGVEAPVGDWDVFSLSNEWGMSTSLAPSLVRRTKPVRTIHMLVGDSKPRYLAALNGNCVDCVDMATAEAHPDS